MLTTSKMRLWIIVVAIASLGTAQLACSLFASQTAGPGEQAGSENENPSGEGSQSGGEQQAGPVEPAFGEDSLPCPPKDSRLILGFDHALTINYEDTSITHFLHQGWLPLMVVDDSGKIVSEGSTPITFSMEGMMSDECTLTGEGTMIPDAYGSCENGVVSLTITEDWQPMQGEMVCIDSDGDVITMPFNVPAMGVQTHSGQDGTGEIFYLVEGSEGYSSMRPFAEGEGYHTWTLYTEDIPLVPLVP